MLTTLLTCVTQHTKKEENQAHFSASSDLTDFLPFKITLRGIPRYIGDFSPILCKAFQLPEESVRFLFQHKITNELDEYYKATFAVNASARNTINSMDNRFLLEKDNVVIQISDFHQPLQCGKCHKYGHSTKNCKTPDSCSQCHAVNCAAGPTCSERCINCGGLHQSTNWKECSERHKLISDSKSRLKELFQSS